MLLTKGGKMAFEQTQKEKAIESLMVSHRQGQIAETNLRLQGKPDEADKVSPNNARLAAEIDILIARMMDEWLGNAELTIKGLLKINANLEAAVAEIKKQIDVARNVVKIMGLIDDAVAIAKNIAAGL
jgi:hypothetical protein